MILPLSSWEAFMVKEGQSNMQLPRDGKRDLGKEGSKQASKQAEAVTHFPAQKGIWAWAHFVKGREEGGKQMGGKNEKSCAGGRGAVHSIYAQKKGSNLDKIWNSKMKAKASDKWMLNNGAFQN